ncbi:hypothetical protein HYQ46_013103 [Verticillium longisporum]|nr:hypothetical protein HYQ46_013103 [Verticillium longisporum]
MFWLIRLSSAMQIRIWSFGMAVRWMNGFGASSFSGVAGIVKRSAMGGDLTVCASPALTSGVALSKVTVNQAVVPTPSWLSR